MGPKSGRHCAAPDSSTIRCDAAMRGLGLNGKAEAHHDDQKTNKPPLLDQWPVEDGTARFRAHKIDRVCFAERDRIAHHQRRVGDLNACSASAGMHGDRCAKKAKVESGCWDSGRFMVVGNSDGPLPARLDIAVASAVCFALRRPIAASGFGLGVPHRSWGAISLAG